MSEKKNSDIIKQEDHAKVEKYSTFEEFNENTLRVRRNLLIFSVIALFYKLSGATLTDKFSFLGLEFKHTDPEMIDLFLLCIVAYHLIHFIWLACEHSAHYRFRCWTIFGAENKERLAGKYINDKIVKPAMSGAENKNIWSRLILLASIKKNIEQTIKKNEKFKLKTKEESEIIDLEIENNRKIIENISEIFKKESEAQFIKINKWRYHLMETYFPSLIGIFAVFVLVL